MVQCHGIHFSKEMFLIKVFVTLNGVLKRKQQQTYLSKLEKDKQKGLAQGDIFGRLVL